MDYGMRERTQLSAGRERWVNPTDAAGLLGQEDPCRGGRLNIETVSSSGTPSAIDKRMRTNGAEGAPAAARKVISGILTYDQEFYEIFSEIRLS